MKVFAEGHSFEIPGVGRSLGDALRTAGLLLDMRCGGYGTCGRCDVILTKGLFKGFEGEFIVSAPMKRPACATNALEESCELSVPSEALARANPECLELFASKLLPKSPALRKGLAIATDVGTTTVAVALIDLERGVILATESAYNAQLRYGDNVIARIAFAFENPKKARLLQKAVLAETACPLMKDVCLKAGRSPSEVSLASFSGNTVMLHLLFGLPADSLGHMPFTPHTLRYPKASAKALGLPIAPKAEVIAAPSASGFIGGDLVSGVLTDRLAENGRPALLLDLGTNCETCLFSNGKLTACASAAGPAFEGAGIECGRRAAPGAIDKLMISPDLNFNLSTIGGLQPDGLCGSAMIDFLAEGRSAGILNEFGRLDMPLLARHGRAMKAYDGISACRIDTAGKVFLSERDIEQLLKAKAAIAAGLKTLCQEMNCPVESLGRIVLAGGFAQYINLESAIAAGMLPNFPLERYEKIGNSSLAGAATLALCPSSVDAFNAMASSIETFVLNEAPSFEDNYIDALYLN